MKKALLGAAVILAVTGLSLQSKRVYAEVTTVADIVQIAKPVKQSSEKSESKPVDTAPAVTQVQVVVPEVKAPVMIEVASGDTLIKIAEAHGTTYKRIFDANPNIASPNIINPGDQLRIPEPDEVLEDRVLPVATPVAAVGAAVRSTATASAVVPVITDGNVWDALAACESGGRWNVNTGNDYYGGLQFNSGTWLGNGGGAYAERADLASREQQIDIASRVAAGRGFSPWPACARKLGLL